MQFNNPTSTKNAKPPAHPTKVKQSIRAAQQTRFGACRLTEKKPMKPHNQPPKIMKNTMSSDAMDSFVVETKNGKVEWTLHPECRNGVIPIAGDFGMSGLQLLALY